MVKRNPHIAVVTTESGGFVHEGRWLDGKRETFLVPGRYDPAGTVKSGSVAIRRNASGDEKEVSGEFYTTSPRIEGAARLAIASLGIDAPVICWDQFQSHSVISI